MGLYKIVLYKKREFHFFTNKNVENKIRDAVNKASRIS